MTPSINYEEQQFLVRKQLQALGIPIHRYGYKQLCIAIPYYAEHSTQSITKELYPYIAEQFGYVNSRSVERSMRYAISTSWKRKNSTAWDELFPNSAKSPSNALFIATLAEQLR